MKTYLEIYLQKEYNPTETAKIIGKSRQRIYDLEKEGKLVRNENNLFTQDNVFDSVRIKSEEKNLFMLIREFFKECEDSDVKKIKKMLIIHLLSCHVQDLYPLNRLFFKKSYFKELRKDFINFLQHYVHLDWSIKDTNFMRNFYLADEMSFVSQFNNNFDPDYFSEYHEKGKLENFDILINLDEKNGGIIFEGFLDFFECIIESDFTQSDTYKENIRNSYEFYWTVQRLNREEKIKKLILGGQSNV